MRRYFLSFFCLFLFAVPSLSFAKGVIDLTQGTKEIREISVGTVAGDTSLEKIQNGGMSLLRTFKTIIGGLAVIFMVYAGIQMILAMGSDEKGLSAAKRTLYFSLTAFFFINIPGQLYEIFGGRNVIGTNVTNRDGVSQFTQQQNAEGSNIFLNYAFWNSTIENGTIQFIKVLIFGIAILMFTIGGAQIIMSGGDEKARAAARSKLLWGVGGLIAIGVIEVWLRVVYGGNIAEGQGLFAKLANLALFFAGPTAIFFLLLGGYYFVTSAGDEEKAKKGKNIVINTAIAILILLASYTFLKDLADLKFF